MLGRMLALDLLYQCACDKVTGAELEESRASVEEWVDEEEKEREMREGSGALLTALLAHWADV